MAVSPKRNENGRAPMFRFLPAHEVLVMEKFRAMDVGHGAGVDEGIQRLPAAETKGEAEKLASALAITLQALFDLVTNRGSIGYVHAEGHRRDVPEGRALTSDERIAMLPSKGAPDPKVLGKVRDGYREQTHLSWHSFMSATDAAPRHCIFYELRGVAGDPLTGGPTIGDDRPARPLHLSARR